LLLAGIVTCASLIWHVGPSGLLSVISDLSPIALGMMLLPSLLMYLLETYGWRLTLRGHAAAIPFGRLWAIRTAGEVVNLATPTAYLGGEAIKAMLLRPHGVPMIEALASVITAKTTMTLAQMLFLLIGLGVACWLIGALATITPSAPLVAALLGMGVFLVGVVLLVMVQRRGFCSSLLTVLRWCRIRIPFLEARTEKLAELDRTILAFYAHHRRTFLLSVGCYFLGWLAEAVEVYTILWFIGGASVKPLVAVAIGALSVLVKSGTFFIPGSLGAQEGGNVLVLLTFGYSELTGLTFALVRRMRELVWIAVGLVCFAAVGGWRLVASENTSRH
jgi:uncharacterized protein (TIRG00374 family)